MLEKKLKIILYLVVIILATIASSLSGLGYFSFGIIALIIGISPIIKRLDEKSRVAFYLLVSVVAFISSIIWSIYAQEALPPIYNNYSYVAFTTAWTLIFLPLTAYMASKAEYKRFLRI